tara:strand:+ start:1600 stop:1851 length:252 start_codon:yes stop_codon:yes gene_type:complete
MKKLKRGDLVYLPSEVTLFKFSDSDRWGEVPFVNKTMQTPKPMTTAFIGLSKGFRKEGLCKVLYNGEVWSVEANNIFLGGNSD